MASFSLNTLDFGPFRQIARPALQSGQILTNPALSRPLNPNPVLEPPPW